MDALGDGAAGRRYDLVIVLHFLTLVHEGRHGLLTTFVNEDGGDGEDGLGMEILLGISDGKGGIYIAADHLKHCRIACDHYVLGQLRHLFGGRTSRSGDCDSRYCKDFNCFFHK